MGPLCSPPPQPPRDSAAPGLQLWVVHTTLAVRKRQAQLGPDWRVQSFHQSTRGLRLQRAVIEDPRGDTFLGARVNVVEWIDRELRLRMLPGCEDNIIVV